ncbi:potassium transporter TrkA [Streptomyces abyssalis]|uniref:Potassium transporter TrkA n=2 Tax=Streptomyces abyssalis TaxID=933944 RepID=A0A1E7JH37_9ACTN|nr:potassium transporter TrkA [Streptomyces abyssalis]OEU92741.1 potassium transporter TrkA [Streptomyces abyssalis]
MVVCGDNALAQRVTRELATVYGQHVTVVLPSLRGGSHGPQIAGLTCRRGLSVEAVEARVPDDDALVRAGIERASALALTSGDDQLNIYIALRARRLNPRVRLVIRMFNRNLGQYLADLLDRAARLGGTRPRGGGATAAEAADTTTTVLSDSDTAAPSIVAAAVVGSDKVMYADGLLLRAKERTLRNVDRRNPLCTLALMPATEDTENGEGDSDDSEDDSGDGSGGPDGRTDSGPDDGSSDGARGAAPGGPAAGAPAAAGSRGGQAGPADQGGRSEAGGRHGRGPVLLPGEEDLSGLPPQREAVVLEAITRRTDRPTAGRARRLPRMLAFKELFSRRLRYSLVAMTVVVLALATVNWVISRDSPLHAGYVTLLDLFAINEPNLGEPADEQVLQLLAGLAGMMLLPLLLAVVLESYGSFRKAAALPTPPRGMSGHVVLVGLGKVGKHVLERLLELNIPVVCIEQNDEARGIALARRRRVPTLIADVTDDGVLEQAKIKRSRALIALTSTDGINLEASLNARQIKPELRVVMRLFDDAFAATVYRTLRDTYPAAQTRSRSVSALAAPAFAGAMMGRQVLGAISVGRRVLVFAAVDVRDNPLLEGRTVEQAFQPEAWRVVALDTASEDERQQDLSSVTSTGAGELEWRLHPGYVLQAGDRVVVASTRRGLSRLLAPAPATERPRVPGTGEHPLPDPRTP